MDIQELASSTTLSATKFELTNFVIGAQDRPSRIIKQLSLESEVRVNNIRKTKRDIIRNGIQLKQLEDIVKLTEGDYNSQLAQLDVEDKEDEIQGLNNTLYRNEYELQAMQEILDTVSENLSDDDIRHLNSPEGQEEDEAAYWIQRLSKQASGDVISGGRIQNGNMMAILNLPEDMQKLALKTTQAKSLNFNNTFSIENDLTMKCSKATNVHNLISEEALDKLIDADALLNMPHKDG